MMVAVVVSQIRAASGSRVYTDLQEVGTPRWFVAPIVAAGFKFIDTPSVPRHLITKRMARSGSSVICFNPSIMMMFAFLIPGVRKIALYQWRPIGHYSLVKRWALLKLLKSADVIVVYSYRHKRYLRRIFPGKRIKQVGLYVDTEYFSRKVGWDSSVIPSDVVEPFIFAPGDHLRDHAKMIDFAAQLGVKLVITTRDKRTFDFLQTLHSPQIEVHFDIPFDQLRAFYCSCLFVLILSDSRFVPTGITTLSEALACSADVIINNGNACSYAPDDQTPSISVVSPTPSVDELLAAADVVIGRKNSGADVQSLNRPYVEAKLSLTSHKAEWQEILAAK